MMVLYLQIHFVFFGNDFKVSKRKSILDYCPKDVSNSDKMENICSILRYISYYSTSVKSIYRYFSFHSAITFVILVRILDQEKCGIKCI